MLTASEYYALQAGASQGLALLWLTVAVALLSLSVVNRAVPVRLNIALPFPALSLPRLAVAPMGLILLGGLALRLVRIGENLWYDEAFTAGIASLPFDRLGAAVAGDVHPPLWYGIEWLFVHLLGTSEIALRLPSLLFGLGTVLIIYRLALVLQLGERTALVAAAIVAVLPAQLYYSVEARAYTFLSYLALYALAALLGRKRTQFAVMVALLPITHNLGYVYAAVLGIMALHRYGRHAIKPLALASLPALLWLPSSISQSRDIADGFWLGTLTPASLLDPLLTMTIGRKVAEWSALPSYALVILLLLVSAWFCRRWLAWPDGRLLLAFAVGVPAAVALASVVWRNVYLDRGLMPCVLALVLLWAHTLRWHPRRGLLTALTALALAFGVAGYLSSDANTREPAAAPLLAGCAGADHVYTSGIPAALFSDYYLPQPVTLWPNANDLNQSLPMESKQAFGWHLGQIDRLSGDVCIVTFTTPLTSDAERQHLRTVLTMHPPHAGRHDAINMTWHIDTYRVEIQ